MVIYLIIGIIVAIVEMIWAYIDMKKLGMTIYDINPNLTQVNRAIVVLTMISIPIELTLLWPWQAYHWIRRIVTKNEVQETEEGSA